MVGILNSGQVLGLNLDKVMEVCQQKGLVSNIGFDISHSPAHIHLIELLNLPICLGVPVPAGCEEKEQEWKELKEK